MRLLIIGAMNGHIATAGKIALERGAKVTQVDSVESALDSLRAGKGADLVMVDITHDISRLVAALEQERISVTVVACGIKASAQQAAAAIKAGAKEFVPLPPDPEMIAAVLAAVTEETTSFIYRDPVMAKALKLADQVAGSEASVLITGESGTGKEVMARYIHSKSKRAANSFVSVNCAAIPENLLESELFGHEKGAFTGAVARRIGKFEEANNGTLLLDEVTEMHPRLQAKLLRAIQEREIDRVGSSQPVKVNIRLLATSNRDMEEAVRKGDFREDLYYRLNVVNLELPPLRDRQEDIAPLSEHFAQKYAQANGVDLPVINEDAVALLKNHGWRGNVRELENTMHRAVLLASDGVITPEAIHLTGGPTRLRDSQPAAPAAQADSAHQYAASAANANNGSQEDASTLVGRTVAEVERDLIIDTLQHCLGNRTHAANILGISIRTLRNKLKQYNEDGIQVPLPRDAEARTSF
ncbi:MAG: sigma-54 interaction domain-containing protein [Pseudomonadota bacterium]